MRRRARGAVPLLALGLAACSEPVPAGGRACAEDAPALRGADGLLYRADARVVQGAPDTLWVEASVTNWGAGRAELQWDAMALRVQVWPSPELDGPPAWDTQHEVDPATGNPVTYPGYARMDSLSPGVSIIHREWRLIRPMPLVRGDSLPPGVYHLRATLRLSGDSVRISAGCVRLD
jgi:hypothetical protein